MRLVLTILISSVVAAAPALAAGCRPALDTQMVHFVGKTPASVSNPLFRLVGGQGAGPPGRKPPCSLTETVAGRR